MPVHRACEKLVYKSDARAQPRGLREITFREVVSETRAQCKGYYSGDIARLVARELAAEGIKVWRCIAALTFKALSPPQM